MAQSVEELRLESERNRAALAATVDHLRERLSDTAEDIRQKVSPQHIKSEVSDFISDKTQSWLGALKQQAMDNPMQTIAAGTAVGVPLLRLARGFPLPLLMMGAGLALSSKTVRSRAAEAAGPAIDKVGDVLEQATERAQALVGNVRDGMSSAQSRATDLATDAQDRAGDLADNLGTRATRTTSIVTDKFKDGVDAAKDSIRQARSTAKRTIDAAQGAAAAAPEKARRVISDNAALIGGLGIAIGAIIAAALPKTEAETNVMGGASDSVKQVAKEATQSGFEAVKETTMSAAGAAAKTVAEADLGAHASRMTQNLADTLKEAAEAVVTAAVSPSQKPNT